MKVIIACYAAPQLPSPPTRKSSVELTWAAFLRKDDMWFRPIKSRMRIRVSNPIQTAQNQLHPLTGCAVPRDLKTHYLGVVQ